MTYIKSIELLEAMSKRKLLYPIYLRFERMGLLFEELGIDPASPSIHIAGTSGKGSTSSLCAEVLKHAGYRTGLHTTPHLQTPRERMQVNGLLPSETVFAQLVNLAFAAALKIEKQNSYGAFNSQELLFTIAALYFKRQRVDIAVIETFMGGQYDPTNIVRPLLSVITNVDLDHTRLLGKTVEAIALVKAGVIKAETPFITGATQSGVIEIFQKRATDLGTNCIVIGQENKYQAYLLGQKGSVLSAKVLDNLFAKVHLKLLGKHQINNALMVLYIIQVMRSRGWLIADQSIRDAFAQAFIPGRLEIVQNTPLIILDGAHNPAKTKALATALKRIFKNKKIVFVFSMKKGKDLADSLKPLIPLAAKFILTRFSQNKAQPTAKISSYLRQRGLPSTTRLNPITALELALRQVKKDQIICVTGSLYLVGLLRERWHPSNTTAHLDNIDDTAWSSIIGEPIRQSEVSQEAK